MTNVPHKMETGKNKVAEDKISDVENNIHRENKCKELDSHFVIGENVEFAQHNTSKRDLDKKSWTKMDNPNDNQMKDHMKSDIFHMDIENSRNLNKVKENIKKENEFAKKYTNFELGIANNETQILKQKNLRSHFDQDEDLNVLHQATDKMKGWKE